MRALLLLVMVVAIASADDKPLLPLNPPPTNGFMQIGPGFLTGEDYLKLAEHDRTTFCGGFIGGVLTAPMFSGEESKYSAEIRKFLAQPKTVNQVEAVFTKYVRDHPKRWDQQVNMILFSALCDWLKEG